MAEINWLIAYSARSCEPFRYLLNCDWKRALDVDFALSLASVLQTVWPFVWSASCSFVICFGVSHRESARCSMNPASSGWLFAIDPAARVMKWLIQLSSESLCIFFAAMETAFCHQWRHHWCFPLEFRRLFTVLSRGEMSSQYLPNKRSWMLAHTKSIVY